MVPLLLALLVLALAAGVLAAMLTSQNDGGTTTQAARRPATVTAEQTVGTTVATTVVTTTAPGAPAPISLEEAVQLTDQATELLAEEQWDKALSTQRHALKPLEGTYTDEFRYETYAGYNMGRALAELGHCDQALRYLDRSEELQGHRHDRRGAQDLRGRLALRGLEGPLERFFRLVPEDREDNPLEVPRLEGTGLAHHDLGALRKWESADAGPERR
jgi:tetratricopeptide (TPR) repeat protein